MTLPPSPEALIQRLRRESVTVMPELLNEAADALAAYQEALQDFRRENLTLRNAAVTAHERAETAQEALRAATGHQWKAWQELVARACDAEEALRAAEQHAGQCKQCGTWTCGFCGMHDQDGNWWCEKCHGVGPLAEAIKRAEAAERARDEFKRKWEEALGIEDFPARWDLHKMLAQRDAAIQAKEQEIARLREALLSARVYVEAQCGRSGLMAGMAEQNIERINAALASSGAETP